MATQVWLVIGSNDRLGVSGVTVSLHGCVVSELIRTSRRCGRYLAS
jgi:hypothetical protein